MTWEQWTIAILMVIGFISNIRNVVSERTSTPAVMTIVIMFAIAFTVGEALVLHSGGFW